MVASKDHSYSLILDDQGQREMILDCDASLDRVRRVAGKIKKRMGRKIILVKDGKELPGGANALDREAYDRWLEMNQ